VIDLSGPLRSSNSLARFHLIGKMVSRRHRLNILLNVSEDLLAIAKSILFEITSSSVTLALDRRDTAIMSSSVEIRWHSLTGFILSPTEVAEEMVEAVQSSIGTRCQFTIVLAGNRWFVISFSRFLAVKPEGSLLS